VLDPNSVLVLANNNTTPTPQYSLINGIDYRPGFLLAFTNTGKAGITTTIYFFLCSSVDMAPTAILTSAFPIIYIVVFRDPSLCAIKVAESVDFN
jgi:hypothetical protein